MRGSQFLGSAIVFEAENMKKNLGFRHSDKDPEVPDYLSKEELLSASKDCLSWNMIETDTQKIYEIIHELKVNAPFFNQDLDLFILIILIKFLPA